MLLTLRQILENRYALRSQFYVNIKTTVATTRLGVLWWILDPLLLMLIYYFVVKIVFDRGGPDYHLFALCGIVTWQSFARCINLCTSALLRSAALIKQASLPMVIYVFLSPVVQAFFYIIGLVIIMIWNYPVLGWHTAGIFILILMLILISFTAGLFLSVFEVYSRDTEKLVTYLMRFGFYISPVLYSPDRIYGIERIPEYAKILYSFNPMVHFITAVRDVLFYGRMFSVWPILMMFGVTLLFMQIGLYFFRYMAPNIPKRL